MEHRIAGLKPPVTFIYGSNDWMDPAAAERMCKTLQQEQDASGRSNGQHAHNGKSVIATHRNEVLFVADAGHFVFMEQPAAFDEMLLDVLAHLLPERHASRLAGKQKSVEYHGVPVDEGSKGVSAHDIEAAFIES